MAAEADFPAPICETRREEVDARNELLTLEGQKFFTIPSSAGEVLSKIGSIGSEVAGSIDQAAKYDHEISVLKSDDQRLDSAIREQTSLIQGNAGESNASEKDGGRCRDVSAEVLASESPEDNPKSLDNKVTDDNDVKVAGKSDEKSQEMEVSTRSMRDNHALVDDKEAFEKELVESAKTIPQASESNDDESQVRDEDGPAKKAELFVQEIDKEDEEERPQLKADKALVEEPLEITGGETNEPYNEAVDTKHGNAEVSNAKEETHKEKLQVNVGSITNEDDGQNSQTGEDGLDKPSSKEEASTGYDPKESAPEPDTEECFAEMEKTKDLAEVKKPSLVHGSAGYSKESSSIKEETSSIQVVCEAISEPTSGQQVETSFIKDHEDPQDILIAKAKGEEEILDVKGRESPLLTKKTPTGDSTETILVNKQVQEKKDTCDNIEALTSNHNVGTSFINKDTLGDKNDEKTTAGPESDTLELQENVRNITNEGREDDLQKQPLEEVFTGNASYYKLTTAHDADESITNPENQKNVECELEKEEQISGNNNAKATAPARDIGTCPAEEKSINTLTTEGIVEQEQNKDMEKDIEKPAEIQAQTGCSTDGSTVKEEGQVDKSTDSFPAAEQDIRKCELSREVEISTIQEHISTPDPQEILMEKQNDEHEEHKQNAEIEKEAATGVPHDNSEDNPVIQADCMKAEPTDRLEKESENSLLIETPTGDATEMTLVNEGDQVEKPNDVKGLPTQETGISSTEEQVLTAALQEISVRESVEKDTDAVLKNETIPEQDNVISIPSEDNGHKSPAGEDCWQQPPSEGAATWNADDDKLTTVLDAVHADETTADTAELVKNEESGEPAPVKEEVSIDSLQAASKDTEASVLVRDIQTCSVEEASTDANNEGITGRQEEDKAAYASETPEDKVSEHEEDKTSKVTHPNEEATAVELTLGEDGPPINDEESIEPSKVEAKDVIACGSSQDREMKSPLEEENLPVNPEKVIDVHEEHEGNNKTHSKKETPENKTEREQHLENICENLSLSEQPKEDPTEGSLLKEEAEVKCIDSLQKSNEANEVLVSGQDRDISSVEVSIPTPECQEISEAKTEGETPEAVGGSAETPIMQDITTEEPASTLSFDDILPKSSKASEVYHSASREVAQQDEIKHTETRTEDSREGVITQIHQEDAVHQDKINMREIYEIDETEKVCEVIEEAVKEPEEKFVEKESIDGSLHKEELGDSVQQVPSILDAEEGHVVDHQDAETKDEELREVKMTETDQEDKIKQNEWSMEATSELKRVESETEKVSSNDVKEVLPTQKTGISYVEEQVLTESQPELAVHETVEKAIDAVLKNEAVPEQDIVTSIPSEDNEHKSPAGEDCSQWPPPEEDATWNADGDKFTTAQDAVYADETTADTTELVNNEEISEHALVKEEVSMDSLQAASKDTGASALVRDIETCSVEDQSTDANNEGATGHQEADKAANSAETPEDKAKEHEEDKTSKATHPNEEATAVELTLDEPMKEALTKNTEGDSAFTHEAELSEKNADGPSINDEISIEPPQVEAKDVIACVSSQDEEMKSPLEEENLPVNPDKVIDVREENEGNDKTEETCADRVEHNESISDKTCEVGNNADGTEGAPEVTKGVVQGPEENLVVALESIDRSLQHKELGKSNKEVSNLIAAEEAHGTNQETETEKSREGILTESYPECESKQLEISTEERCEVKMVESEIEEVSKNVRESFEKSVQEPETNKLANIGENNVHTETTEDLLGKASKDFEQIVGENREETKDPLQTNELVDKCLYQKEAEKSIDEVNTIVHTKDAHQEDHVHTEIRTEDSREGLNLVKEEEINTREIYDDNNSSEETQKVSEVVEDAVKEPEENFVEKELIDDGSLCKEELGNNVQQVLSVSYAEEAHTVDHPYAEIKGEEPREVKVTESDQEGKTKQDESSMEEISELKATASETEKVEPSNASVREPDGSITESIEDVVTTFSAEEIHHEDNGCTKTKAEDSGELVMMESHDQEDEVKKEMNTEGIQQSGTEKASKACEVATEKHVQESEENASPNVDRSAHHIDQGESIKEAADVQDTKEDHVNAESKYEDSKEVIVAASHVEHGVDHKEVNTEEIYEVRDDAGGTEKAFKASEEGVHGTEENFLAAHESIDKSLQQKEPAKSMEEVTASVAAKDTRGTDQVYQEMETENSAKEILMESHPACEAKHLEISAEEICEVKTVESETGEVPKNVEVSSDKSVQEPEENRFENVDSAHGEGNTCKETTKDLVEKASKDIEEVDGKNREEIEEILLGKEPINNSLHQKETEKSFEEATNIDNTAEAHQADHIHREIRTEDLRERLITEENLQKEEEINTREIYEVKNSTEEIEKVSEVTEEAVREPEESIVKEEPIEAHAMDHQHVETKGETSQEVTVTEGGGEDKIEQDDSNREEICKEKRIGSETEKVSEIAEKPSDESVQEPEERTKSIDDIATTFNIEEIHGKDSASEAKTEDSGEKVITEIHHQEDEGKPKEMNKEDILEVKENADGTETDPKCCDKATEKDVQESEENVSENVDRSTHQYEVGESMKEIATVGDTAEGDQVDHVNVESEFEDSKEERAIKSHTEDEVDHKEVNIEEICEVGHNADRTKEAPEDVEETVQGPPEKFVVTHESVDSSVQQKELGDSIKGVTTIVAAEEPLGTDHVYLEATGTKDSRNEIVSESYPENGVKQQDINTEELCEIKNLSSETEEKSKIVEESSEKSEQKPEQNLSANIDGVHGEYNVCTEMVEGLVEKENSSENADRSLQPREFGKSIEEATSIINAAEVHGEDNSKEKIITESPHTDELKPEDIFEVTKMETEVSKQAAEKAVKESQKRLEEIDAITATTPVIENYCRVDIQSGFEDSKEEVAYSTEVEDNRTSTNDVGNETAKDGGLSNQQSNISVVDATEEQQEPHYEYELCEAAPTKIVGKTEDFEGKKEKEGTNAMEQHEEENKTQHEPSEFTHKKESEKLSQDDEVYNLDKAQAEYEENLPLSKGKGKVDTQKADTCSKPTEDKDGNMSAEVEKGSEVFGEAAETTTILNTEEVHGRDSLGERTITESHCEDEVKLEDVLNVTKSGNESKKECEVSEEAAETAAKEPQKPAEEVDETIATSDIEMDRKIDHVHAKTGFDDSKEVASSAEIENVENETTKDGDLHSNVSVIDAAEEQLTIHDKDVVCEATPTETVDQIHEDFEGTKEKADMVATEQKDEENTGKHEDLPHNDYIQGKDSEKLGQEDEVYDSDEARGGNEENWLLSQGIGKEDAYEADICSEPTKDEDRNIYSTVNKDDFSSCAEETSEVSHASTAHDIPRDNENADNEYRGDNCSRKGIESPVLPVEDGDEEREQASKATGVMVAMHEMEVRSDPGVLPEPAEVGSQQEEVVSHKPRRMTESSTSTEPAKTLAPEIVQEGTAEASSVVKDSNECSIGATNQENLVGLIPDANKGVTFSSEVQVVKDIHYVITPETLEQDIEEKQPKRTQNADLEAKGVDSKKEIMVGDQCSDLTETSCDPETEDKGQVLIASPHILLQAECSDIETTKKDIPVDFVRLDDTGVKVAEVCTPPAKDKHVVQEVDHPKNVNLDNSTSNKDISVPHHGDSTECHLSDDKLLKPTTLEQDEAKCEHKESTTVETTKLTQKPEEILKFKQDEAKCVLDKSSQETTKSLEKSELQEIDKPSFSDSLQATDRETIGPEASKEPIVLNDDQQAAGKHGGADQDCAKTDEEQEGGEESIEYETSNLGSEAPVMVDAEEVKVTLKKSHGILSGVGSKVKHSISKVKKAITGKSSHSKSSSPTKGNNQH